MEKYISLLNPSKIKRDFLLDFISIFSPAKNIQENLELIYSTEYNDLIRLSQYKDRDSITLGNRLSEQERYKTLLSKYKTINKWEVLGITEVQYHLYNKVEHILLYRGGLKDVIIMLNSFSRGTKRLATNKLNDYRHEQQYSWIEKDGNEKLSHKGNLPKGHFRWNFGERYTLPTEDLEKISEFIKPLVKHL